MEVESDAIDRATATYRACPNSRPAWPIQLTQIPRGSRTGKRAGGRGLRNRCANPLDPTLILAVMAIESGFNPFAQSAMGAQGLMQVMTGIHSDKYASFGGKLAAFDPVTNLRVGVKVLQECIARAGSLEGGLKFYVGAAHVEDDGGYVGKVLAEHQRLLQVAGGRTVPIGGGAVIPTSLPVADLDARPASPNS